MPNLEPNSVVVMDNVEYHSRMLSKKPTQVTRKDDILNFINENNAGSLECMETVKYLGNPLYKSTEIRYL